MGSITSPRPRVVTSGALPLSVGGSLSFAHGLGAKPSKVALVFTCLSADMGFAVGDEVFLGLIGAVGDNGFTVYADATSVVLRQTLASTIRLNSKTTGGVSAVVLGSWSVKIRAFE